jgi:hypothetical protein
MLDHHHPIVSPGRGQNHKMVPIFLPTSTTMTSTDLDKDIYYKTELPPLPMLNGKEDCMGR